MMNVELRRVAAAILLSITQFVILPACFEASSQAAVMSNDSDEAPQKRIKVERIAQMLRAEIRLRFLKMPITKPPPIGVPMTGVDFAKQDISSLLREHLERGMPISLAEEILKAAGFESRPRVINPYASADDSRRYSLYAVWTQFDASSNSTLVARVTIASTSADGYEGVGLIDADLSRQ